MLGVSNSDDCCKLKLNKSLTRCKRQYIVKLEHTKNIEIIIATTPFSKFS